MKKSLVWIGCFAIVPFYASNTKAIDAEYKDSNQRRLYFNNQNDYIDIKNASHDIMQVVVKQLGFTSLTMYKECSGEYTFNPGEQKRFQHVLSVNGKDVPENTKVLKLKK